MKSRILVSLLVIALAAAVIGGATMAWFTDEATADPVTFTAGTLMIDIDEEITATTEGVNLGLLNPGDTWEYEFDVENVGTKRFLWGIYACWIDTVGQDNDALPEGQQALLVDRGYGTDPLSEVIEWEVYADYNDGNGEQLLASGILPEEGPPIGLEMDELAAGSEPVHFRVVANLPTDAGNEYQGSTMDIAVGVQAWQATNDAPAYEMGRPDTCDWLWGIDNGDEPDNGDNGDNGDF